MPKQSIRGAVRDALREDARVRKAIIPNATTRTLPDGTQTKGVKTLDSFVNLAQGLGIGADNALSSGTYGFNPITRNRVMLEWIHRGSWLGGVAVDVVADDMTRAGIEAMSDLPPDVDKRMEHAATVWKLWEEINNTIKWSRLYGGAICVALIDGQDPRTPLNINTVGQGQFKGLLTLDRWMVEPSLEDLVTEYGPHMGMPRYYRVQPNAPGLRGQVIHYSRVMLRLEGVQLPYQQRLTENLWGISVLERLYDRMVSFDSATTGAAQLVYKIYLRTLKIKGFRDIVATGGTPLKGMYAYVDMMRRFQGMEGITVVDGDDDFDVQTHTALSGIADVLTQFGQQISGALEVPMVRLFGQSPAGLNATGESDLRMYYDGINKRQNKDLRTGVTTIFMLLGRSMGVAMPPEFMVQFSPLWQLSDTEKGELANKTTDTVTKGKEAGLVSDQTALKELKAQSGITGIWATITDADIQKANAEIEPPMEELAGMLGLDPLTGQPKAAPFGGKPGEPTGGKPGAAPPGKPGAKPGIPQVDPAKLAELVQGMKNGSTPTKGGAGDGTAGGGKLRTPIAPGGTPGQQPGARPGGPRPRRVINP